MSGTQIDPKNIERENRLVALGLKCCDKDSAYWDARMAGFMAAGLAVLRGE